MIKTAFLSFTQATQILVRLSIWRQVVGLALSNEALLAFASLTLLFLQVEEQLILFLFAAYYGLSSAILRAQAFLSSHYRRQLARFLWVLILLSYGLAFFYIDKAPWIMIALMVGVLTLRDMFQVNLFAELEIYARRLNFPSDKLISAHILLLMMMPVFVMPLLGGLADWDLQYYVAAVAGFFCVSTLRLFKGTSEKDGREKPSLHQMSVPLSVHLHCLLSTSINSVLFLCRRFFVPLMILQFADSLSLEESSFKLLGMILAVFALIGVLSRPDQKAPHPRRQMFVHYFIHLVGWVGFLFACLMLGEGNLYVTCLLGIVSMIAVELTSKFWSIGFYGSLKRLSDFHDLQRGRDMQRYQIYLSYLMYYKSIGGSFGFLVAALFWDKIDLSSLVFLMCVFGLFYGGCVFLYLRKEEKSLEEQMV